MKTARVRFVAFLSIAILAVLTGSLQAGAQALDDAGYDRRVELAKKIHVLKPASEMVEGGLARVATGVPPAQRESFLKAMRAMLNIQAIEKVSIDAMAQSFSENELTVMLDYYSKPEAKDIARKYEDYSKIVGPAISKMIDKALMKVRTGDSSP